MSEELDKEIAEKVMGWKRLSHREAYPKLYGPKEEISKKLEPEWYDAAGKNTSYHVTIETTDEYENEAVWEPSTNIACAWLVVEKMCNKPGPWRLFIDYYSEGLTTAEFQRGDDNDPKAYDPNTGIGFCYAEASARTAPLAICLAALAAIKRERQK